MKKVIFWILWIFLWLSAFCSADSIGPVVYNATWDRLYISYWYNYFKAYFASPSHCWQWQFFWIWNYSDYYNWIFNFTWLIDNNLVYWDTWIYLLWYNNWYFLSDSFLISQDFYWSIFKDELQCNTRADPSFFNNSYFNIGFDSSNTLHTIIYNPVFWYTRLGNYSSINSPSVLLYNTDSLLTNSSWSTWFNNLYII